VTGDGHTIRVHAQLGGLGVEPLKGLVAVIEPGRRGILRGQSVVRGHDDEPEFCAPPAAMDVFYVGLAVCELTAVKPQDSGAQTVGL
jgi:hypothetical protein